MYILGIESSCDETAAAIVKDGTAEVSSVVASSRELHEKTGGVVPEIAARKQVDFIVPVIEETLKKAGWETLEIAQQHIDAVAVTVGPGLIGSLIVGIEAAKSLAFAWDKPLIPVNHLVGHIYANFISHDGNTREINIPAVVLVVSGGHTDLVLMKDHGVFEYLGGTLDDAAGEAFDKTARLFGIADYLGGAKLSDLAQDSASADRLSVKDKFPRPKIHDSDYDFSFSGLKTAAKRFVESDEGKLLPVSALSWEFENAVIDVLVKKTINAVKQFGASSILLGGGVSANTKLRAVMQDEAEKLGIPLFVPPVRLCTDNAVYIAGAAYFINKPTEDFESVQPNPSLGIMG
jgi:N6-L-threonylcarbamoyladenine synthase